MANLKELSTPAGSDFYVDLDTGKFYSGGGETQPNGQMIAAYNAYKQAQQSGITEPTKEQYLTNRYIGQGGGELPPAQVQAAQQATAAGQPIATFNPNPTPRTLSQSPTAETAQGTGGTQGDELYNVLQTYLGELQRRGIAVNPDAIIDEKMVAEFLKKAEGEIAPYYATRLAQARDNVLRQFGYTKEQILIQEQRLEQQYGKTLRRVGESAAERGFAQSGIRQQEEQELATATQQDIEDRRRQLEFGASETAGQFAGQFGAAQLPQFSYGAAPRVLAGESTFSRQGGEKPFYSLTPGVYDALKGTEQFEQEAATRGRASELEGLYRQGEVLKNQRTLTL